MTPDMARAPNGTGRKNRRRRPTGYVAATFDGKPCSEGHTLRYVTGAACVQCSKDRYRKNPEKALHHEANRRAKDNGTPFDIEVSDIIIPEFCPVLGVPLFSSTGFRGPNSPSLDRIDNNRGYVKGNIAVISYRANRLKSDADLEDMEKVLVYMRKHLGH